MASFDFYHFEWFESEAEHLLRCVSLWVFLRDSDFLLRWHGLPLLNDAFVWVPAPHFPVANSSLGSPLSPNKLSRSKNSAESRPRCSRFFVWCFIHSSSSFFTHSL